MKSLFISGALALLPAHTIFAAPVPAKTNIDYYFTFENFTLIDTKSISGIQLEASWSTDLSSPQDSKIQIYEDNDFSQRLLNCSLTPLGKCGVAQGSTQVGSASTSTGATADSTLPLPLEDFNGVIRVANNANEFNINSLSLKIQNITGTYIFSPAPIPEPSTFAYLSLGLGVFAIRRFFKIK